MSGPQTLGAVGVGEAPDGTETSPAVHHPDWDGNRCCNCNARLADAGPYCDDTDERIEYTR